MNLTEKTGTILVVEDNEDNRIIYGTMLRAHGFAVHEARDAEEALAAIEILLPSLILMDIGLPEWTELRQLASSSKTCRQRTFPCWR